MGSLNCNLVWMLGGVFAALITGSIARMVALRNSDPDLVAQRIGSLKVWWTLAVLLALAVVFGIVGAALILAVAGILGLREFLNLFSQRRIGRAASVLAFTAVPLQYSFIVLDRTSDAQMVLPIAALLAISTARLLRGGTRDFIRLTAGTFWGVMILVYALSHAALLFSVETIGEPLVGPAGWFLFVVIITEMDDIAQALVGRRIGRHKITPHISPNKTWEGFAGGVATSVLLSLLLAPWLTTFPPLSTFQGIITAVGSGLLIVLAAFLGDINMSAIKRDVGVKDGSQILPGMGGIIDRVDSLTFTAPVFYYFLLWTT